MELTKRTLAVLISASIIIATTALVLVAVYDAGSIIPDVADMGVTEWLEDFEAFHDFVEGNYPYLWLKNRTHGYNWLDLKQMYADRITNAVDNEEFAGIILDAVTALQNRHSYIIDPRQYASYQSMYANLPAPLNEIFTDDVVDAASYWETVFMNSIRQKYYSKYDAMMVYDRGNYVIENDGPWNDLYGEDLKVVAVNGEPIDTAVTSCYEQDYLDWDFQRNKSFLWRISPRNFGTEAEFTIRNSTGSEIEMIFQTTHELSSSPYHYPTDIIDTQVWENESIAYLYVSIFLWDVIESHMASFLDFYNQVDGYDYLIVDIRGNLGGNCRSWIDPIVRPLIKETKVFEVYLAYRTDAYSDSFREAFGITSIVPKESFSYLPPEAQGDEFRIYDYQHTFTPTHDINFSGEIILLVDNVVYSAAEGFTLFCKQTGFATIYGTASGGDGIMEFPTHYRLPNSRIVINLSSALGLDRTGHANEEVRTQPDVYYESSFGNHSELIDFVLASIT